MRLLREPVQPRAGAYYTIQRKLGQGLRDEWEKFLPGFEPASSFSTLAYGGRTDRAPPADPVYTLLLEALRS